MTDTARQEITKLQSISNNNSNHKIKQRISEPPRSEQRLSARNGCTFLQPQNAIHAEMSGKYLISPRSVKHRHTRNLNVVAKSVDLTRMGVELRSPHKSKHFDVDADRENFDLQNVLNSPK